MKTKKKATGQGDIDQVIRSGKAQIEQKQKSKKRRATYFLSEGIIEMIAQNCRGNKSYFVEEAIKFYLENQKK